MNNAKLMGGLQIEWNSKRCSECDLAKQFIFSLIFLCGHKNYHQLEDMPSIFVAQPTTDQFNQIKPIPNIKMRMLCMIRNEFR